MAELDYGDVIYFPVHKIYICCILSGDLLQTLKLLRKRVCCVLCPLVDLPAGTLIFTSVCPCYSILWSLSAVGKHIYIYAYIYVYIFFNLKNVRFFTKQKKSFLLLFCGVNLLSPSQD